MFFLPLTPSLYFGCLHVIIWVCAVPCSRQVLWVMKDVEVEPRGCGSPLLGRLLHVSPHISPPSILFNPNLSHSTLNKDATTWSYLDQTASHTKTRRRTEVIASCFTAACWSTCPSLPLFILPINCLNSAAKFGVCTDMHTSNPLFFPGLIVHNVCNGIVQLWSLHLCHSKNILF